MRNKLLMLFALLLSLNGCNSQTSMIDKTVVKNVDIEKYLGTWYEIARFDHRFERGLVGVTANYSMRNDGLIKVVNSGYKEDFKGAKSEAIGKAKIPDANNPSKLKVSFFWFFYADYFILELDENYQWAVVGSKCDDYLWILSRTPQMELSLYDELIRKISKRGYNTQKLIKVKQLSIN